MHGVFDFLSLSSLKPFKLSPTDIYIYAVLLVFTHTTFNYIHHAACRIGLWEWESVLLLLCKHHTQAIHNTYDSELERLKLSMINLQVLSHMYDVGSLSGSVQYVNKKWSSVNPFNISTLVFFQDAVDIFECTGPLTSSPNFRNVRRASTRQIRVMRLGETE